MSCLTVTALLTPLAAYLTLATLKGMGLLQVGLHIKSADKDVNNSLSVLLPNILQN